MKAWVRAVVETACGGACRQRIQEGRPMQVLDVPGMTRRLVRCEACSGEQAPPNLPDHVETKPFRPLKPMTRLVLLPLDREPGEEG